MIEDKLLFHNQYLTHARYYLYSQGVSPRLIAIEAYSIILFLLVNFGTRLIFLFNLPIQLLKKSLNKLQVVMLLTILITTLIPIFFIQDGGWFNSMQFLYYGVFLSSIFAAHTFTGLIQSKKILNMILAVVIVILTIPNDIEQIRYVYEPQKVISQQELDALDFLSKQPKGVVFSSYSHKVTAYISALSGQQTYFADVDQLMVTHVDYAAREQQIVKPWLVEPLLIDAKYWYLTKSGVGADEEYGVYANKIWALPNFKKIFSNDTIEIYRKDELSNTD
jgi:hypothetical protein